MAQTEGAFDRAFELCARLHSAQSAPMLAPARPEELLRYARIAREAGQLDAARSITLEAVARARRG